MTFFSEILLLLFWSTFALFPSLPDIVVSLICGELSPASSFSLVNRHSINAPRRPTAETPTNSHTSFTCASERNWSKNSGVARCLRDIAAAMSSLLRRSTLSMPSSSLTRFSRSRSIACKTTCFSFIAQSPWSFLRSDFPRCTCRHSRSGRTSFRRAPQAGCCCARPQPRA